MSPAKTRTQGSSATVNVYRHFPDQPSSLKCHLNALGAIFTQLLNAEFAKSRQIRVRERSEWTEHK